MRMGSGADEVSQCWGQAGFRSLWLLVVAPLGHTALARARAVLGVQHPDLGE